MARLNHFHRALLQLVNRWSERRRRRRRKKKKKKKKEEEEEEEEQKGGAYYVKNVLLVDADLFSFSKFLSNDQFSRV